MEAVKCDRCGEFYLQEEQFKIKGGNCNNERFSRLIIKGESNWHSDLELCPSCLLEFKDWVEKYGKFKINH